ncbi:hypothetical protein ACOMHN_065401 [Nucella lapillus]
MGPVLYKVVQGSSPVTENTVTLEPAVWRAVVKVQQDTQRRLPGTMGSSEHLCLYGQGHRLTQSTGHRLTQVKVIA